MARITSSGCASSPSWMFMICCEFPPPVPPAPSPAPAPPAPAPPPPPPPPVVVVVVDVDVVADVDLAAVTWAAAAAAAASSSSKNSMNDPLQCGHCGSSRASAAAGTPKDARQSWHHTLSSVEVPSGSMSHLIFLLFPCDEKKKRKKTKRRLCDRPPLPSRPFPSLPSPSHHTLARFRCSSAVELTRTRRGDDCGGCVVLPSHLGWVVCVV